MREGPALPLYEISVSHDALVSSDATDFAGDPPKRSFSCSKRFSPRLMGTSLFCMLVIALLWKLGLGSVFGVVDVDVASYEVLAQGDGYEIRRYAASTAVATTTGTEHGAFMRLAGFIGVMGQAKNERRQQIPMTAPVVNVESAHGAEMQFILPVEVNNTAPRPTDRDVHLVARPPTVFGVETFSGSWRTADVANRAAALAAKLQVGGYRVDKSAPWLYMRYNPPWTLGPFRRNEVAVQLQT
eukprot:TRINITY_DN80042_c0_g1_i1.p1 TRINITY_DN80042_c0_g1~~TRINITY_DN80042_c0_g1_i1.p1  ORF type:complete len:242 (+),score=34.33 TRINITY_DN80042_c0_g1_i1:79-804(+)